VSLNYMAEQGKKKLPTTLKVALDEPITLEEPRYQVAKGGGNKAPGRDGICF